MIVHLKTSLFGPAAGLNSFFPLCGIIGHLLQSLDFTAALHLLVSPLPRILTLTLPLLHPRILLPVPAAGEERFFGFLVCRVACFKHQPAF